jgi:hypothetical protein
LVIYPAAMLLFWRLMGRPEGAERQVLSRLGAWFPSWRPHPGR